MDRFRRSWELARTSFYVMMRNKTLLLFPILITVLTIFMVILFMMPVAFQPTGHSYFSPQHWEAVGKSVVNYQSHTTQTESPAGAPGPHSSSYNSNWSVNTNIKPIAAVYFAVMYFASMFLATFLNVAFYHEIMNALNGQPVSIMEGISFAFRKWKIILMWTLFAGIVGFIIKSLEERFGWFGEIIMRMIGAVWSIACVFVIPVIVTEEETANPITVLKKSAQTLINTWGESLIGYVGVSFGGTLVTLFSVFWLGAGIAAAVWLQSILLGAAVVLCWLMVVCIFSYLVSVASQIFRCALYLYASQGALPHPYTEDMMALAWKTKK